MSEIVEYLRSSLGDHPALRTRLFRDAIDADRAGVHPFDVATVDGMTSGNGLIRYLGKATRQDDGTWQCVAITPIGMVIVEVSLRFPLPDHDPGDEDPKARS